MRASLLVLALFAPSLARDAGILYEVWHTRAAQAMARVKADGGAQLTTELVLQSAGALDLNDVYGPYNATASEFPSVFAAPAFAARGLSPLHGLSADIFNVKPALGFYCLYRARPGDPAPAAPDCVDTAATAAAHAALLVSAGFDYVAIDVTNWPKADVGGTTDVSVLRPTEVLFEEWAALRARGVPTPQIAVWPCSPAGGTTWKYLLDTLYNNASYADLVYTQGGKKVVFVPHSGAKCYDAGEAALIAKNGGRDDVVVIPMWALFGDGGGPAWNEGVWGFFSPCVDANGHFTTSMIDAGECDQFSTQANGTNTTIELSASGGYMTSQCALPFAAPGHMRGLTAARLFEKVLATGAPHLFVSSFNEFIGGRQAPASGAAIAFNQGLANDSQRLAVWVDTYGAEMSRDVEPSVEGGNRTWTVMASCVRLYKAGLTCADAPTAPCCTRADKEVFASVWSLHNAGAGESLLTADAGERAALVAGGAWTEKCSAIANPTAFCVNTSEKDGRAGPFILYNNATVEAPQYAGAPPLATVPLERCITAAGIHFFSTDAACEGLGKRESTLGWMAARPGVEMLRPLRRCREGASGEYTHALDLHCTTPDADMPGVLGYVR
jgi:hypothetical protein